MTKLRYALAILLGLFAVLTLLDRFVLIELLLRRTAIPLLLAAIMALAMAGFGALFRRAKQINFSLDLLIGYPIFGTLCFLVASLNISDWTLLPVLIAGAVAAVVYLLRRYSGTTPPVESVPWHWSAMAVVVVLACGFIAAQAPPSSLDELAYHLAVPHAWILEGRVVELPLLSHSYFPLGIESADLLPLHLLGPSDGGVASHFIHLFAAIATTLLILRRTKSWLATAAIATTPALAIIAGWSLVDWPLTGLFVALYIALTDDDVDTASAATAAGLLTKYTFAPFALVAWAIFYWHKRRLPRWQILVGIVFFARNLILTGNPFAPFFGTDAPHVSGFRALALADYIFEGTFIDEALGASLVILPVFATGMLAIAAAVIAIGLFFLAPSSRILVPFLVVPAMSAAPALKRRVLTVMIAIAVVVQTFMVVWFTARTDAFSLLAASATEEEYLRKQRPSYGSIEWLNLQLPLDSRTLLVGSGETYWFTRRVRGAGNFDGPRVSRYLDVASPEVLRERLRADGITHIAVVTPALATNDAAKLAERQTTLSAGAQKMLSQTLDRYASNMTARDNATLFTLR
ncbi:MAG TPA: hypothetical protein VGQ76_15815 [Thermoanaerobaculia bacterium]|jgi:hypothetical protein|nr:hypothetical protein [Thermoanaerobaculia bacterium]